MKIRSNPVGTTMPRADYAETNPKSAAYIKNKPDEAIKKAQETADNALPKAGGDVTGDINMSGNIAMNGQKITGVATPSDDGDAANRKYVDDEVGKSLPKSGGTMTGALNMGSKQITNMADPTSSTDGANKNYVDTAVSGTRKTSQTIAQAQFWSSSAPYTLTVSAPGVLPTDMPHVSPVYSADLATAIREKESWAMVSKAEAGTNTITLTCFEDKPEVNVTIQVEVNR